MWFNLRRKKSNWATSKHLFNNLNIRIKFIEWAYNFSHIDKETYLEQISTILDQYKVSVEAYKDKFNGIDDFCQKYGLTDCKYAINRVKQGNVIISNESNKNNFNIIFTLTQRLNDTSSFFLWIAKILLLLEIYFKILMI